MTPQEIRASGSDWCETCKVRKKCNDPVALEATTDVAGKPAEICHCYKPDAKCFKVEPPAPQGKALDLFGAGAVEEPENAGAEPETVGAGFNPNCDAKGKCFKPCESGCDFYVEGKAADAGAKQEAAGAGEEQTGWECPECGRMNADQDGPECGNPRCDFVRLYPGSAETPMEAPEPPSDPESTRPLRGRDPASAAAGDVSPVQTKAEQFIAFHALNPNVYRELVDIAKAVKKNGWPRASVRMVLERFRWLHARRTRGDVHKVNNNFAPYYARLIMAHEPALDGFFDTRGLSAQELFDPKGVAV